MIILGEGIFLSLSRIDKLYRRMCARAVADWGFTPNEIVVLMFLANNAPMDTATDIVRYRGISKSLVAKSVDNLMKRGFLLAARDTGDRRIVHLALTKDSGSVVKRLRDCRRELGDALTKGISHENQQLLNTLSKQMEDNLNNLLKEDNAIEKAD